MLLGINEHLLTSGGQCDHGSLECFFRYMTKGWAAFLIWWLQPESGLWLGGSFLVPFFS